MQDKVFPIISDTACVFKWTWNTFRLYDAKSSSCHRVTPVQIPLDQMSDFHNTSEVLDDRKKMLAGEWPVGRGCEYCADVEKQGGTSDRMYHNNIPGLTPVDFDPKGDQKVTPRIVELYLANTCDLACVYCFPEYSSRINQELKKYGPYPVGFISKPEIPKRDQYFVAWLDWVDKNYQHLEYVSILGGEPLLQKELWGILDFVAERQNRNLTIAINTNLNSNPNIIKRFVEVGRNLLINKNIKKIHVNVSLDCWGPQQEFIRHGLDLTQWQENFEYLIQQKWLEIGIHHTVTALSINTTLDLQSRLAQYKIQNPKITQCYHLVDSGQEEIYHPGMFGGSFFKSKLDELVEHFPITTEWDLEMKKRLVGIVKMVSAEQPNRLRLSKLLTTLDMTDTRRGTQWRKLFPYIDQYFIENNIQHVV